MFTPVSATTTVIGIDPGLATGGMVLVRVADESVLAAQSLVVSTAQRPTAPDGAADRAFTAAALLAGLQGDRVRATIGSWTAEHGRPAAIACEGFVDQRSRAREEKERLVKDRWKTPLVIGHLARDLADLGYTPTDGTLVYTAAGVVLRQFARELAALNAGAGEEIVSGARLLTNQHLRSAWCHAAWMALRYRKGDVNHTP